ncbi:tetratricopeptide repeat protein [Alkalihalobacillus oceani]|uniref:tetratricopeptide repeat protein n=1 Tax=Halalkalibacter oceani TaxID=1653776 RepID=UPI00203BF61E|nr:tetratricopeptide repeat protein [Halalkalibacter oceani]MCM3761256.1 tetratricopeptide repeat protein [Halalkalibacter oceani]
MDWFTSWHALYQQTEKKWAFLSPNEQKKQLTYLEETAGTLLDEWTQMDELVQKLREEGTEQGELPRYQSTGTVYYQLEMFTKAAETLQTEQAGGDEEDLRLLYTGFAFLFAENEQKAQELFLYLVHAARKKVFQHFAYIGLGCIHARRQCFEEAIVCFERANQLITTADVVYNLGVCYYVQEAFHLAEAYFLDYIEQVTEDEEAYFFLGCCQWLKGDKEAAWVSWLTSIHVAESTTSLLALAHVCEWHGYHQTAVHCYKRIQESEGVEQKVLHGLAWNYALTGEVKKAMVTFRKALQFDPFNSDIRSSIGWLEQNWPEEEWGSLLGAGKNGLIN